MSIAAVIVLLSLQTRAAPSEHRERLREKREPIVKIIKKVIRSLGDGLVIPIP